MTDTSALIPNQVAVSSDCLFNLKPSAVRSKSIRASIPASNKQTFAPGDTVVTYIPGGRRASYLDPSQSYVRYTVKNNDATVGNTITFDNNGASVIDRLDIFHGSNLLESVQGYNILYSYVLDFNLQTAQRNGLSTMYGTDGASVSNNRAGTLIKVGGQHTVCMPILSGIVGLGADKNLPLGLLGDDIRLEWVLAPQLQGMVATNASTSAWSITSFELELCIIELSDEGENIVRSVTPPENPIYLHGNSWRHYVSTLTALSGTYSTLVPARFCSLKSLVCLPRRNTEVSSETSYSLSSRVNPNFSSYFWRIGSAIIPSKSVVLENTTTAGFAEAFAEIQKAWHSLDTPNNASCCNGQVYCTTDSQTATYSNIYSISTGANSYKNGFAIAQELESMAQRSDILMSGTNTLSSNIFFETNINTAPATTYTLDFYANYDHIIVLQDGLLTAKF